MKLSFVPGLEGGLTVSDSTAWPSGGTARSAVRLHLFMERRLGEKLSGENAVPNTGTELVSSWLLAKAPDGCYTVLLFAVPPHDNGAAYPKNALVSLEQKLYRASANVAAGTAVVEASCWKEVTGAEELLSMSGFPNAHYLVARYFRDEETRRCLGEKALAYAQKSCGCSDVCSQMEDYHWTLVYHSAAVYSFGFGDYPGSGKLLGAALDRCGSAPGSPCNCH